MFKASAGSAFKVSRLLAEIPAVMVEHTMSSKAVKELIQRNDLSFDLVISEEFFQDAYLMFGHKFKAPLITFSKFDSFLLEIIGKNVDNLTTINT